MFVFQLRRDYSWQWVIENPTLAQGEPGVETNTGRFKLGDGLSSWNELPYFVPGIGSGGNPETLSEHVYSETPHPVYDNGPSLFLLYENAKV